jgi:hypothetical protein
LRFVSLEKMPVMAFLTVATMPVFFAVAMSQSPPQVMMGGESEGKSTKAQGLHAASVATVPTQAMLSAPPLSSSNSPTSTVAVGLEGQMSTRGRSSSKATRHF